MLTEGAELADSTAARVEAAKRIGQLLYDHANQLWVDEDWQMDVTDNRGLILYAIQVSVLRSAATTERKPNNSI
jgi:hypothetical protein